jgi:putative endonuclease
MFYVYILKSLKDNGIYIGKTNDLKRRIYEHNNGYVQSTKSRKPFIVLDSFQCQNEKEALILEKEYKKGYKREEIKIKYNLI